MYKVRVGLEWPLGSFPALVFFNTVTIGLRGEENQAGPRRPHFQTVKALMAVGFPRWLLDSLVAWLSLTVPPGPLLWARKLKPYQADLPHSPPQSQRGSCPYSKTLAFSLGFKKNVEKKHPFVSGDLREWPVHKDPLSSWKRKVTIRAGSLKVTCKLLWSAGCGRIMVWVSRGRIHVIVLLLLFQADDWVCLWF